MALRVMRSQTVKFEYYRSVLRQSKHQCIGFMSDVWLKNKDYTM